MMTSKLTPHEIRLIAVRAMVDPRTVLARLSGKKVHSTTAAVVDRAVEELGFAGRLKVGNG